MGVVFLYHKGHGNLKSALPSDTSKLIGGIGRHSAKHRMISSLKSINPKNPKNGQIALLNTCINWYPQEFDLLGRSSKSLGLKRRFLRKIVLKKSALILLYFGGGSKSLDSGVMK